MSPLDGVPAQDVPPEALSGAPFNWTLAALVVGTTAAVMRKLGGPIRQSCDVCGELKPCASMFWQDQHDTGVIAVVCQGCSLGLRCEVASVVRGLVLSRQGVS